MSRKPDSTKSDSARLRALFEKKCVGITQVEFGKLHGLGSQGMVWQYLEGRAPLNVRAAKKFAAGLGVAVADFSPSLAKKITEAEEGVERVQVSFPLRTDLRRDMLHLLAERSIGTENVKLSSLYEEAIREYLKRNASLLPKKNQKL